MNSVSIQKTFHRHADSRRFWNRVCNPFLMAKERRLTDRIARLLPRSARRVLEVGCGEGGVLSYLRERRPDVQLVGMDFSFSKLAFLAEHCPEATPVCGDAAVLPFAAGAFDAVIYRDVLHHVNWARRQVLEEGLRVVKPQGVVVIIEANGRTLLNRLFQRLYPAERGLRDSTRPKLAALVEGLGCQKIESVEASFLVRAIGFVIGWPAGAGKLLVWPVYAVARCWEVLVERLVPEPAWTYMMMSVRPR
jgi:ubiquinone/menaquinone biosynthesis C-methylase UbiE